MRRSPRRLAWTFATRVAIVLVAAVAASGAPGVLEAFQTRALQSAERSFVWKVSNDKGVVHVAGSVHLLTPEYYPLPPAFMSAFAASDLLVEELDMAEMLSTQSQMQMLSRGLLPAGQTLERIVSAETFQAVSKKLADLGMPPGPMQQFKPWLLALTLQGLEWQKAGFNADLGVDKYLYDLAMKENKPIRGLETLAFQLSRFDGMSAEMQDRMLSETLRELESTKTSFTQIADAWKAGDAAVIEQIILQDLKSDPAMYERMLVERNRMWLPQIEALVGRPKPAFVVVGAAHLVGADGLLQMLRAKGYTVQQL
jgi:uncharacterized protein YbaP (TraB family)